jgi:hypothetical protein
MFLIDDDEDYNVTVIDPPPRRSLLALIEEAMFWVSYLDRLQVDVEL